MMDTFQTVKLSLQVRGMREPESRKLREKAKNAKSFDFLIFPAL
jgi:hypothetical protein